MGALDSLLHNSYPVGAQGKAEMKVLDVALHNIIFHVAVHTYTWRGELHYSYQVPVIAGGDADEREVVGKYVGELERLTMLVAGDAKEDYVRDTRVCEVVDSKVNAAKGRREWSGWFVGIFSNLLVLES